MSTLFFTRCIIPILYYEENLIENISILNGEIRFDEIMDNPSEANFLSHSRISRDTFNLLLNYLMEEAWSVNLNLNGVTIFARQKLFILLDFITGVMNRQIEQVWRRLEWWKNKRFYSLAFVSLVFIYFSFIRCLL